MSSPETAQHHHVLLIDDDAISREVLAMTLEIHGFRVDSAESGEQALSMIEKSASAPGAILPDAILMDTQMPGLSGIRLIRALRQAATAPIVAISGSEVSDEIHQATDGFLLKPVSPESVVALLRAPATQATGEPRLRENTNPNSADDTVPFLDLSILKKLKAMMPPAAVQEIYVALATDMEARLVPLSSAIDAGDAVEVARIAHIIKGGCVMVGLFLAAEAAASLESSNASETWPKQLLQLHFALSKLQSILVHGLP